MLLARPYSKKSVVVSSYSSSSWCDTGGGRSIMLFISFSILIFVPLITQTSAILANGENPTRNYSSIDHYYRTNTSKSSISSSTNPDATSVRKGNTDSDSSVNSARTLLLDSTWQEAYLRFLDHLKRVRGMWAAITGSRNNTISTSAPSADRNETIVTDSVGLDNLDASSSSSSSSDEVIQNNTLTSSNRSGRTNGFGPWSWPWTSTSGGGEIVFHPPPLPTTRPAGSPLNRIFIGPYEMSHPINPIMATSTSQYIPPPPGPGSNLFGRGQPSDNHYNYVYKYNPKSNSAVELQQHTTTTVYIICICLVIMLVGTVLFAFVTKCQETTEGSSNTSSRRGRRSSRSARRSNSGTNANGNVASSSRPEISVVVVPADAPPSYPKVALEPPPSYDSLFPTGHKQ